MMKTLKSSTTIYIAMVVCGFSSAAFAGGQDAAVADSDENSGNRIDVVTVTAPKRSESMQKVPLAVTALGGNRLREDGIVDLGDVGAHTPGMSFGALSPAQPEISIRGIGSKEDGAATSDSVVVSVDDVYIASRTAQIFDIFDLERVEVLRGPQGTLYGKNSIAGSLNFVTSKPTEDTTLRFRQKIGNYGRFDTAAMISGQIAENLYGKFSFSRRQHDGYYTNILESYTDPLSGKVIPNPTFGEPQNESNTFAWRSQFRWEAAEDLEVTFIFDGADDHYGSPNREPVGSRGPLHDGGHGADPVAVNIALGGAGSPFTSLTATDGFMDRGALGAAMKIDYDVGWASFKSISAYRDSDMNSTFDATGLPPAGTFADLTGASGNPGPALAGDPAGGFSFQVDNPITEVTRQYTQELRLTSPGGETVDWVGGFFFSKESVDRTEGFIFPSLGGPGLMAPSDATTFQYADSTAIAGYAQATYNASDRLSFTGGLRYSSERRTYMGKNVVNDGLPLLLGSFELNTPAEETWGNLSWKGAASYEFTDDIMAYGSVSTGFKSGGFTGSASTLERATNPYDSETVTNYELGLKSMWFDNRFLLNVSAFQMDYKDLQVTRFFQPDADAIGEFITENAGEAEIKGVEVEFMLLPVEGVEFGGSYGYLDGVYTSYTGSPGVGGSGDFSGARMRQAPEHMLNLYAKFTRDLGGENGSLSFKVDYRYQDEVKYDPNEDPLALAPAYDLWDAGVTWVSASGNWNVKAWAKNIANKEYQAHVYSLRAGRIAFADFGAPQTFGVTTTLSY